MQALYTPARQKSLVRTGAWIVIFAALLPSISFIGHWPFGPGAGHIDSPAEAEAHVAHCHTAASQCTGDGAMVGAWWIGEAEPLAITGNNPHRVEAADFLEALEPLAGRLTPPPRIV
jgi:hypothetical protein